MTLHLLEAILELFRQKAVSEKGIQDDDLGALLSECLLKHIERRVADLALGLHDSMKPAHVLVLVHYKDFKPLHQFLTLPFTPLDLVSILRDQVVI